MMIHKVLIERIKIYNGRKRESSKAKDAIALYNSMLELRAEASDNAQYAGFMRYLLRKSSEVREAVMIINQHKEDIGLSSDFDWGFRF